MWTVLQHNSDISRVGKSNKSESPWSARLCVLHNNTVNNLPIPREIPLQIVLGGFPRESSHEQFTETRKANWNIWMDGWCFVLFCFATHFRCDWPFSRWPLGVGERWPNCQLCRKIIALQSNKRNTGKQTAKQRVCVAQQKTIVSSAFFHHVRCTRIRF